MKLNNKGFAISTIMYMIMILAVLLITLTLALLSGRKLILDKLKVEVQNNIYNKYDLTYRETLNVLKEEAINYAYTNVINKVSIKISDLNSGIDSEILDGYNLSNKYLTVNYNNGTYDTYLGQEKTITDISKPIDNMLDIVDYKIEGNTIQRTLPEEYQQVEYIESTGTQYIDTGIIPNQDTGFDIEFLSKNDLNNTTYGSIMGAREQSVVRELQLTTFSNGNQGTLRYGTNHLNAGLVANTKMHVTLKNKVYNNNNGLTYTVSGEFESPNNLTVFALNDNTYGVTQYGKVQLYSLKLYDGDKLIRNYIPCYRKNDNVIGLYDLVENKFYVNKGTGTFIKGKDSPTPEAPVEIKSVGDNINNLLPYPYVQKNSQEILGVKWTLNEDRSITVSGTSSGWSYITLDQGSINFEAGKKYYFKCDGTNSGVSIVFSYLDENGERKYDGNGKIWKDEYTNPHIYLQVSPDVTASGTLYPYVVEENKNINYDLYGENTKIPVKVTGKNLFNINHTIKSYGGFEYEILDNVITLTANATYGAQYMSNYVTNLDSSKKYTFSYKGKKLVKGTAGSPRVYILIEGSNDGENYKLITYLHEINPVEGQEYSFSRTLTGYSNYKFSLYNNTSTPVTLGEKTQYYDIQLEEGTEVTEYEPYVENVTTNIYLDEPLRKIENNVDSIVYKEQEIIKNTNSITLTGLENEWTRWQESITDKTIGVFYSNDDVLGVYQNPKFKLNVGFSNYFKIKNEVVHTQNDDVVGIARLAATSSPPYFGFKVPYTDLSNWLSHLQRINSKGNPLKVEYVLNETENISTVLPHINTEIGANKISIDTEIEPSNVEFTIIEKIKQF